ncbi:DUF2218 domain-containing protein [Cognatishimia sp. WU-CL00825]|uniref:DUF2218 domain-containing protein n=1 Tax=Cognatishimia sp. WU-CL00825 TaxID=3127658 RepID=UPI003101F0FE
MKHVSSAKITTPNASGYLQQLCKHFGHKIDVVFSSHEGKILFPFGSAEMIAKADQLVMVLRAEDAEALAKLQQVMSSHLTRFAFREDLQIKWSN